MSAYWCALAWVGGDGVRNDRVEAGVLIELDGDRIGAVTTGVPSPPAHARRLPGLTLPGLANAHSHAFQRALRGRTQKHLGGSFWSWREEMYAVAETLTPAKSEALARATFAEMVRAGITLVGEFDYVHHSRAILSAARAVGIRLTLLDACYLHGGHPAFHDDNADAWAQRSGAIAAGPTARLGAAIHSVRAVDPDSARVVARTAAERGWPLHAHVSEQPAENEECVERYGLTPLEVLAGAGAVTDRFTAVHATHVTETDARTLRRANAFCCLCPTTERDLADGIGRAHGRLTLGSDSHAVIDLLEEARAVELDERLRTRVRGTYSASILATGATEHGYASLGWPEGGRIAPGALADLTTVGLTGLRLAGTRPEDALEAVLFAGTACDVDTVIVGGREIVSGGSHVTIDVAAELETAIGALAP